MTVLLQSAHNYNVPVGKQFARLSIPAGRLVGLTGQFEQTGRTAVALAIDVWEGMPHVFASGCLKFLEIS
jgi:hypothetical protein